MNEPKTNCGAKIEPCRNGKLCNRHEIESLRTQLAESEKAREKAEKKLTEKSNLMMLSHGLASLSECEAAESKVTALEALNRDNSNAAKNNGKLYVKAKDKAAALAVVVGKLREAGQLTLEWAHRHGRDIPVPWAEILSLFDNAKEVLREYRKSVLKEWALNRCPTCRKEGRGIFRDDHNGVWHQYLNPEKYLKCPSTEIWASHDAEAARRRE